MEEDPCSAAILHESITEPKHVFYIGQTGKRKENKLSLEPHHGRGEVFTLELDSGTVRRQNSHQRFPSLSALTWSGVGFQISRRNPRMGQGTMGLDIPMVGLLAA